MEIVKVKDTTLPDSVHKCALCCCLPNKMCCSEFEHKHGFDDCNDNHHHYKEIR